MGRELAGACYRELGAELRQRREKAGLSSAAVADATGWNRSRVSRIESGHIGIGVVDVIHYLAVCGVRIPTVLDLLRLCEDAERELGYWLSPPGEQFGAALNSLVFHESTARAVVLYDPMVINGLLQTADYARTLISRETWRDEGGIENCVNIRVARRQILHRPRPAGFTFVVHEQALRNLVGSGRIMHEQLLQVVLLSGLDHVSLRVIPTSEAEQAAFGGSFQLLDFAGERPMVHLSAQTCGIFLEDAEYVHEYRQLVPLMSQLAWDQGQSREFVASLASEYDRGSRKRHANIYELEEEHL